MTRQAIPVLGAGSFGTSLACVLARNGYPVKLWGRNAQRMEQIQQTGRNDDFLPEIELPDGIEALSDLAKAVTGARDILVAVPSHSFRSLLKQLRPHLPQDPKQSIRLIWATKGLDGETGKLLDQVVKEELGDCECAVLSGPTFAAEIAVGLPTAIVVAANNEDYANKVIEYFHSSSFRLYRNDDMTGVQIGGSVKNVLAIATGICDGLNYGANARTALITRGLAEMTRLGMALGAHRDTFDGLAGIGDLMLTCTDNQSRNRRFGLALGQGVPADIAEAQIGQVVEGAKNAAEVKLIADQLGVEMPITEQVFQVLHQGADPKDCVAKLLARSPKVE
ncbi:NAD(P)H-dependent glycerol-3-phosphate dehydrogenase [Pelagibaculum spongiae]|uniref:Glycerol-3-phosphate dehydrogenase [NAD(P)+] n=1 Tax=Pelagibaculum spongiae TaxID=2080658 RepID=A0A2V1GS54_9GAMM|nr:NAD(P)H-dependent glycerol-3-phosphate dehydrogenase [Pelagibaculum spongiae]PVZ68132.1 glycerol-3-phosphate dehydrogenase [Pelagibaculum spongiae]